MRRHAILMSSVVFTTAVCPAAKAIDPVLEPKWLPVRDLVVDAETPMLDLKMPEKDVPTTDRSKCICVRGIYPVQEQLEAFESAFGGIDRSGNANVVLIDFKLQRQCLAVDAKSWVVPKWDDVNLDRARRLILNGRTQPELVPNARVSQVMTMPLPRLADGSWDASASHPRLDEFRPSDLLFRFIDFDVRTDCFYRYRVKLVVKNPQHQGWSSDPFIRKGLTRETPWSRPSAAILVAATER